MVNSLPPKGGGFGLPLKAGSVRSSANTAATHVTLKLSSGLAQHANLLKQLVRTELRATPTGSVELERSIDRPGVHNEFIKP